MAGWTAETWMSRLSFLEPVSSVLYRAESLRERMQRKLLDILACPMDKHYPLQLIELNSKDDIVLDGVLICSQCGRYYPVIDEIPVMLPDNLRERKEDLAFLERWRDKIPSALVYGGKPWSLERS